MTPPHDDERFDWQAAEADLTNPGAEVVDLDDARARRTPRPRPAGDTHFDVTLDEMPQRGGMLVDPPPVASSGRRPILPSGWSTWPNIKHSIRQAAELAAYRAGFHTVRAPWYAAQATFWATVGAFRLTGRQLRWWWVSEQTGLRQAAADAGDAQTWHKLHREVKATRAWRGLVLTAEALTLAIGGPIVWATAPWWALTAGTGLVVAYLAHVGRPDDRPIITPATVAGRFRRVNPDIILRAYYAAGLGNPDKPHQRVEFGSTMARDPSGTGSQVSIDLPYGKTFDDAVKARGAIASGLDVAVSQVFITRDPSSHRRHTLWVADRDPLAAGAGRTPLLRCKPTDIWQPAPFGLDERGNKVAIDLMWNSVL
ncbi:cell division protein FtsK, partial [Micromonospora sp. B11E3]